jgi:hypothetical protein
LTASNRLGSIEAADHAVGVDEFLGRAGHLGAAAAVCADVVVDELGGVHPSMVRAATRPRNPAIER